MTTTNEWSISESRFRELFPNASLDTIKANCLVQNPEPQRDQEAALGATDAREAKSAGGIIVRFTGYRVKPLDPDNFAGSVKDLLDGLRYAHIIPGDEPWNITLETRQARVQKFDQERTEIEILWTRD